MPFGGGPRICIGNHCALMEAQLILATWIYALRFELVSDARPGFDPMLTLRPARPIRMRVQPRPTDETPRVSHVHDGLTYRRR